MRMKQIKIDKNAEPNCIFSRKTKMNIFKRMYINFILNKEAKKIGIKRRKSKEN